MFYFLFFFFNDTATTEIYTLSLHDALPISRRSHHHHRLRRAAGRWRHAHRVRHRRLDRKSTPLNSRHDQISDSLFCFEKKKKCTLETLSMQTTDSHFMP